MNTRGTAALLGAAFAAAQDQGGSVGSKDAQGEAAPSKASSSLGQPTEPRRPLCVGRVWHCCRVPLMIQSNGVTEVWGPPRCAPCGDSQQQGQGLSECFGDVLGVCCGGSESSPRGAFRTP